MHRAMPLAFIRTAMYDTIYASPAAYMKEVDQTANPRIYQVIHARPIISRARAVRPAILHSFWDALRAQGYIEVGWNALTGDADGTGKTAAKSVENLKNSCNSGRTCKAI